MKLSELKDHLKELTAIHFRLPNNQYVPAHFHVTEIGKVTKEFMDCGGTLRREKAINFQLYSAEDFDHRLAPQKLLDIIELSEKALAMEDWEIEVEFQSSTIGKYRLRFADGDLLLLNTQTDCLAKGKCGIPEPKKKLNLSALPLAESPCTPGSGCC